MTGIGPNDQQVNYRPFVDSRELLERPDRLREHMGDSGYLFVSGLVPPEALREVYDDISAVVRAVSWADEENRPIGSPPMEGDEAYWDAYDPVQCLESFHALAHRPEIVGVIKALVQEEVLVHPRNIARIVPPQSQGRTTPPHQDNIYIQGTPDTYSMWMPLMDCPIELGGLCVLEGSHRHGVLPVYKAAGPGGLAADTEGLEQAWRASGFRTGDALFFHSRAVHAAFHNQTADTFRVSIDYRYQGVSEPIIADGLLPHFGRLDWERIYQGWENEGLKYYWKKWPLQVETERVSYHDKAEERG